MPEVHFGRKDEPATKFAQSEDLIAIRTNAAIPRGSSPVRTSLGAVTDGPPVLSFPEANVAVYRVDKPQAKSVEAAKSYLESLGGVRFAGHVLVEEGSGEPVVYTENLFAKFVDEAADDHCVAVLAEHGLTVKRKVEYANNAYFAAAPEGTGQKVFEIAQALLKRDDVEFCHPEVVRRRASKAVYPQQWHLRQTEINGQTVDAHAGVEGALGLVTGRGITIAVIDDGVDTDHPEFAGKITAARDVTLGTNDARPKDTNPWYPDDHGTACAGVACAAGVQGASGVAPEARLMPIRLASTLGAQAEADAFFWAAANGADVISCSWGPPDGKWTNPADPAHTEFRDIPASTRLAIDHAATEGRGGKGCVILFAAGNGGEGVEYDGYASYPNVIAVAACNDRGVRSAYSDFGPALWCSFPSNDFEHPPTGRPAPLTPGIWTTDRRGTKGYNFGAAADGDPAGNFTSRFGGTSSACPGAAGVAALVLSANPDLTREEVKTIIAKTCDKIDETGGNYDAHGWSPLYGYGRVNAEAAVRLALEA
jgi:subtilisin family serine protease